MKLSVSSSATVNDSPATVGMSLLLSSRSVKSVVTVALAWPEPSLAVTRNVRSLAPAGGLPLKVRLLASKLSQAGRALVVPPLTTAAL